MQKILSRFLEREANEDTIKEIHTTLQTENLFDEIKVSIEPISENEVVVNISLKEKISFLPLPMVGGSTDSFMGGLFIMDMNAFGIHDMFIAGGIFSKDMQMGMASYTKAPHKKGEFGFSGGFNISHRDMEIVNLEKKSVFEYEAFSWGISANLLYKLTNNMNLSLNAGYGYFNPQNSPLVFELNQWTTGATWNFSKSSWNGIFLSSNGISVSGTIHFTDDADYKIGKSASVKASLQIPVVQKIRLIGTAAGFIGDNLYFPYWQSQGAGGVSILPPKFRTQEILGITAGAEFCVLKMRFGMLTLYSNYQAAFAKDWDKTTCFNQGFEAGGKIYLSKIAFPAVSVGASYNLTSNFWQFAFSLGMSF